MKILHLCNKMPFPGRDGSSIAMESLIRLESKLGHDVTVLALNTDKHHVSDPQAPHGVNLISMDVAIQPTLGNYFSQGRKRWSYFASRFYQKSVAQKIELCTADHDIVVIDSLFMAVYLDHIDQPTIIRAHNIESKLWQDTLEHMPWMKRALLNREVKRLQCWEREVLSQHPVLAITPEDLDEVQQMGGRGLHVPCSTSPDQWPYSGAESHSIYHLGAMDWFPNIEGMDWLIKKVAPLLSDDTRIHVLSKSQPKEFNQLPQQIHWIQERVTDKWFDSQGIFVAPIRSGSGMRIKLLEAMSRGKAIVTTTIGAQGLMVTHDQHLLIADSAHDFAQAVEALRQDPERRNRLSLAASEHVKKKFQDDVVSNELRSAFQI